MTLSSDPPLADVEEKTEVIYGVENIINDTIERISAAKEFIDGCMDSSAPSTFVIPNHPITHVFRNAKRRGIQLRFIAEITKDNIGYCKELMKISELRHLDEVKGNFGIVDRIYYRATAVSGESGPPPSLISSSICAFVQQQQYFFEMLWKKAIPARQRINEIEKNLKREFIETIQDSEETTSLISKVLSSATEEIQMIFSRANTLKQYERLGIFSILREKADDEVAIRIMVGTDDSIKGIDLEWLAEYPQIELRSLLKSIKTRLTTIVTDRELSLVIEERKNEDENDLGLATYSNSESTVLTYASIFENLWMQSLLRSQRNE
jgi:two-component system sensor histidine kinase VicK